jgi:hypothetical protein
MDTFVVRVYRLGQQMQPDDDRLRGVVEEISTGFQATFHDAHELLSILRRPQRARPGVSPPGAVTPRAPAPLHIGASGREVHRDTQPSPTQGGSHESGVPKPE